MTISNIAKDLKQSSSAVDLKGLTKVVGNDGKIGGT